MSASASEPRLEQKCIVAITLLVLFVAIGTEAVKPDVAFFGALTAVLGASIVSTLEALSGFASESVMVLGMLFLVTKAVERTNVIDAIVRKSFAFGGHPVIGTIRMYLICFSLSIFFDKTALLALMIPPVRDWGRAIDKKLSQMLMPLSFSVLLGSTCSMLGSTSLVVYGLMEAEQRLAFTVFAPLQVAVPIGLIGIAYLALFTKCVLPKNKTGLLRIARDHADELTAEVEVLPASPIIGKTLAKALDELEVPSTTVIKIRRRVDTGEASEVSEDAGWKEDLFRVLVAGGQENGEAGKPSKPLDKPPSILRPPKPSRAPALAMYRRWSDIEYFRRTEKSWGRMDGEASLARISSSSQLASADQQPEEARYFDIVAPDLKQPIMAGDILFFACAQHVFTSLSGSLGFQRKGLLVLTSSALDLAGFGSELIECVLADSSPLVGLKLSEALPQLKSRYGMGVLAFRSRTGNVSTDYSCAKLDPPGPPGLSGAAAGQSGATAGQEAKGRVLSAGDLVLAVVSQERAAELARDSCSFFVVSLVGTVTLPISPRGAIPVAVFAAMLGLVHFGLLGLCPAAMLTVTLLHLFGWLDSLDVSSSEIRVLFLTASAISFSKAIGNSGLAADIVTVLHGLNASPQIALFIVYGVTLTVTELVSNAAAASLMYPIAVAYADALGADFKPFAMVVLFATSAAFANRGHGTNMMVWQAGGYKFIDFVRFGLPLDLICMAAACLLVPRVWGFEVCNKPSL